MNDPVAIQVINIFKSFRQGRDQVLKGISVNFPEGKLTYILGPSGTGKSVLLKHVLGLLKPDSGEVWVHHKNISKLKGYELSQHRLKFGMLFQDAALFDDYTVFENVAFPLREHTRMSHQEISSEVKRTLSLLGMRSGYDKFPNELSGGMRKRVGLARAIIRSPSVLLYDEPTTGLDPITRMTVDDLIATLKEELNLTSIVISHDIPSALRLADQVIFLYQGQAVFCGTVEKFKQSENDIIRQFIDAELRTVKVMTSVMHATSTPTESPRESHGESDD